MDHKTSILFYSRIASKTKDNLIPIYLRIGTNSNFAKRFLFGSISTLKLKMLHYLQKFMQLLIIGYHYHIDYFLQADNNFFSKAG